MATCTDQQLAECLVDEYALTCCSCEQAERLRCIALARLKELTCGCMTRPVQIGTGDGAAKFISPVEAMDALRRLIELTYVICQRSAEYEGPVMETIYEDRCSGRYYESCSSEPSSWRFHQGSSCIAGEESPSNKCS